MLLSIWRRSKTPQGLKHIHFSLPYPAMSFRTEAEAAGSFHLTAEKRRLVSIIALISLSLACKI